MVVPMRHVSSLGSLEPGEHDALFRLVRDSVSALEAAIGPEGVNVGLNLGRAAGAGIQDHLHVHIVPRWVGDVNFMPVVADTRVMPEYLDRTWDELSPHFVKLSSGVSG
jgi:ATP adenylyltransferase